MEGRIIEVLLYMAINTEFVVRGRGQSYMRSYHMNIIQVPLHSAVLPMDKELVALCWTT